MSRGLINITKELYRIFDILNENYFDSELGEPIITIQKQRINNLGHFIWGETWTDMNTNKSYYEINLNPINLDRDIYEIIGTLLHEMCHYYNCINNINDCNGNKHNKKFKTIAEKVDLIVDEDNYGITYASDELKRFIDENVLPNKDSFGLFMDLGLDTDEEKKPRKKTQFKYICPKCGMVAKAKAELNIICGACGVELEMETEEE